MDFEWLGQEHAPLFTPFKESVETASVSVYQLMLTVSVYASALAVLLSAVILIINSTSGGEKLSDAKKYAVRVFIVSILLFGASGLVLLVNKAGMST